MADITQSYRGIVITYNENSDSWNCELFSRPADSLRLAKERIDKHFDTEKNAPFIRFKAYARGISAGAGSWPLVEVTGLTDDNTETWCVIGKTRHKVRKDWNSNFAQLHLQNDTNDKRVAEIHRLEKEVSEREDQIRKLEFAMEKWTPALTAEPKN